MGNRLNANAEAVFEVVKATHTHPTALDIYAAVKTQRPHIGLASVYRILHSLAEQGYIKELGRTDEGCRYDAHIDRHDHAVCTDCGALIDVPLDIQLPTELLQQAAQAANIDLSSYELRLYGHCRACSEHAHTPVEPSTSKLS